VLDFSDHEIGRILRHGPWPMASAPDPSNRVSGHPQAIALGRRLFSDERLSVSGTISCATCHRPEQAWTDGKPRSEGLEPVDRNTLTLLDVRLNRWFGWDGSGDSLWAQSVRPMLDAREMGMTSVAVARLLRSDTDLSCRYRHAFGQSVPDDDAAALADAGKALAAFQETLTGGRSPFDDFRDALAAGDRVRAAAYPLAAQRGLRIFIGVGACGACHLGPRFSNGEFHDIGIPFFAAPGRVDPGRHGGIQRLNANPYNLLGRHNDDAARSTAAATAHVMLQHRNWGEFKVPSLRNVALTAPYMHNGSLATLADTVRHYSELDENRLHVDGERLLRPLRLSEQESRDLVAFLETLTGASATSIPETGAVAACR